jgi:hypothetical protein
VTAYYLGGFTVGECLPIAVQALGAADASIAVVLPNVTAKLAGALEAQAQLTINPPTLAGDLQAVLAFASQLQAAIALGLPSAGVDLAAMAAVIAEIQAELGSIQAQVSLSLALGLILAGAGVHLIAQEGTLGSLGSDIASETGSIGPSTTASHAVCLVATTSEAWAAISAAVRVS